MNRLIRICFIFSALWGGGALFAQTMIGESGRMALDTTAGVLVVDSDWHCDSQITLRISTRWSSDSVATLRVNGVEVDHLSADEEKDFNLTIPANSCGTYLCKLSFGENAYTRTIRTTGARKMASSSAVVLDTLTGSKLYTGKETLRYDTAWYANAVSMRITEGASTLVSGDKGDYAWMPSGCGEHQLLLEALDGAGLPVASLSASIDVWDGFIGIVGDDKASVTGNETDGFVVRPSSASTEEVVVNIPDRLNPAKVTIEVSPDVARLVAKGAKIKVVRGAYDITPHLDIPEAVAGVVDLSRATVKASIVKEVLDASKGARIDLNASSPSLTTAPTVPGLIYTLREGPTLQSMSDGATKIGDGNAWTPTITIKGGPSGFYTIRVSK